MIYIGDTTLRVIDTQKVQDKHNLHICEVVDGEVSNATVGKTAVLSVDIERRKRIMAHHSATHLVQAALRKVLGDHVKQSGSRVDDNTLRFDYSHYEQPTEEQLRAVQELVNAEIRKNSVVSTNVMPLEEAKKTGAMAFFGEKYGSEVRVVSMGDFSKELCGGTHVSRTGDIGFVLIESEGGISAGVRRIECKAGAAALEKVLAERAEISKVANLLKSEPTVITTKIEALQQHAKELEKENEKLKGKLAVNAADELLDAVITSASGIKVIAEKVTAADIEGLKTMVDRARVKLGSGVVALSAVIGDAAALVVGVTSDLAKTVHAGDLVKEASKVSGGRGGGRPDFAQAGGIAIDKLSTALDKIKELVK